MPIFIGIITARQSLDNIRQAEQSMKQHCKISYFPYDTLDELRHQYTKAAAKSDGLLFSGPFPHDYICENIWNAHEGLRCSIFVTLSVSGVNGTFSRHFIAFQVFVISGDLVD